MNKTENASKPFQGSTLGIELSIFAICLIWFSWFLTPLPNWNIYSRAALASSIVLDHSVAIDRYPSLTGDIACVNGHYYSDKGPGASWVALPWLTAWSFKLVVEPRSMWQMWLITFFVVSIPAALLSVLIFRYVLSVTSNVNAALLSSLFFSFSTIILPYSTLFYFHVPVALILFLIFMLGSGMYDSIPARLSFVPFILSGFLTIVAFTAEFQSIAIAAPVCIYFLYRASRGFKRFLSNSFLMAAGGAVPAACWIAYNMAVFGKPIDFGYHHECIDVFLTGMTSGIAGFTIPEPGVVFDLLLLPGRGLLSVSPFLLLMLPGLLLMFRRKAHRAEAITIVSVCAIVLAMNFGIYQPLGGAGTGPRYLIPMLPFCAAAAGIFLASASPAFSSAAAATAVVSFIQIAAGVITDPHAPRGIVSPVAQFQLPMILDGYFRPTILSPFVKSPLAQILPLLFLTILAAAYFSRCIVRSAENKAPTAIGAAIFTATFVIFSLLTISINLRTYHKFEALSNIALSDTYRLMNMNGLSRKHFRLAMEADADYTSRYAAAELYKTCSKMYSSGDFSSAESCLIRLLKISPGNMDARKLLDMTLEKDAEGSVNSKKGKRE